MVPEASGGAILRVRQIDDDQCPFTKEEMQMKTCSYILEIYKPNSTECVWSYFEATDPFVGFNAGDLLDPGNWADSRSPVRILRIVNVEHKIWETNAEVKQKLLVYTEEVEASMKTRLSRKR